MSGAIRADGAGQLGMFNGAGETFNGSGQIVAGSGTIIYTHVLNRGGKGVLSPAERF